MLERNSGTLQLLRVLIGIGVITAHFVVAGSLCVAQPPVRTIGRTVADEESEHYRFERFTMSSPDASRTWRVNLAIPKGATPDNGFPSFWMLDGNACLLEFNQALLKDLSTRTTPTVLVFIGHDNDLRTDSQARYRDYTPTLTSRTEPGAVAAVTGGADSFLDVIEREIRPKVMESVKLAPGQQTLWGHSLGGLFVLHAFFTRPGAFDNYIAGSPSLWWDKGVELAEAERFIEHNAGRSKRIVIHLGEKERTGEGRPRDTNNQREKAHLARLEGAPPDSALKLAARLQSVTGVKSSYQEFPGLSHGPMFRASLMQALQDVGASAGKGLTPTPAAAAP
ncbi:Ferri-bacillibactin esterase BesA [Caulifigura coniformis]|uniref:Ferri-bacillibactin esterase BesA n=1 Tax=Caulifigura coniformis TaxID=2527983 RepID=A0A517SI23_9PLAN|nr:alpha/beta hydrolase-fold protein [Caulifigura coniformis]QDT55774.1 Ferri-bacillibactin esterase BesA [Caulifigura coniformis]